MRGGVCELTVSGAKGGSFFKEGAWMAGDGGVMAWGGVGLRSGRGYMLVRAAMGGQDSHLLASSLAYTAEVMRKRLDFAVSFMGAALIAEIVVERM